MFCPVLCNMNRNHGLLNALYNQIGKKFMTLQCLSKLILELFPREIPTKYHLRRFVNVAFLAFPRTSIKSSFSVQCQLNHEYGVPKLSWNINRKMQRNAEKYTEMQKNAVKCREIQRNVEKCSDMKRNAEKYSEMQKNAEECRGMLWNVEKCRKCRFAFMTFMTHGNVILDILEPPFRKYSTCWVLQKIEECCRILKKFVRAWVVTVIHAKVLPDSVLYIKYWMKVNYECMYIGRIASNLTNLENLPCM